MSHENFITFNCNYVYIKYFNHHFNFCVSKSFYYGTDDALLQKAFTDILNCCDILFAYILFHMANLIRSKTFNIIKCDAAFRNLVTFVQFKKREKPQSFTFSKAAD